MEAEVIDAHSMFADRNIIAKLKNTLQKLTQNPTSFADIEQEVKELIETPLFQKELSEEQKSFWTETIISEAKKHQVMAAAKTAEIENLHRLVFTGESPEELLEKARVYMEYASLSQEHTFDTEAAVVLIQRDKDGQPFVKLMVSGSGSDNMIDNSKIMTAITNSALMLQGQTLWSF